MLVVAVAGCDPNGKQAFNSAAWAAADQTGRAGMCRDLMDNHLPSGTTEVQVLGMLGNPDDVHDPKGGMGTLHTMPADYLYGIDGTGHEGWDAAFLMVRLDGGGHVTSSSLFGY